MNLTRRMALKMGFAAAAAATVLPRMAQALADQTKAAIEKFTGGASASEGGIDLNTPEIAENGNTVPVEVTAEGAESIMLLADGNPNPGVATLKFGPLAGASSASIRIRLAGTQDVVAVAKMSDGAFARTSKEVKVTIGGCGG